MMSTTNVSQSIKDILKGELKFSDEQINQIESSPTFVMLLNKYKGKYMYDPKFSGAQYDPETDTIRVGAGYKNFITLAHELGHGTGDFQRVRVSNYSTAEDFSLDECRSEGEAIYYGVKVWQELSKKYDEFKKDKIYSETIVWLDDATSKSEQNYHSTILNIIEQYKNKVGSDLFYKLGEFNAVMIPSGQDGSPELTYDEDNKWFYLNNKLDYGDLASDYEDVMNKVLEKSSNHAKSLLNRANNHFGENGNDEIRNHHARGTNLAKANGTEDLLYGGKGNDTIYGNSGKDVILGGDNNDVLYGGGDDTLAGGKGNDFLYGGADNDLLDGEKDIDHMEGGDGNDIYIVDNEKDTIIEKVDEGHDNVISNVTYTLSENLERLLLTGKDDIDGTGNNQNNEIIGNEGNNTLKGLLGNNTLEGGKGADTLIGGSKNKASTTAKGQVNKTLYKADSEDTIKDFNDGKGTVQLDEKTLTGGIRDEKDRTVFKSANGKYTYTFDEKEPRTLIINDGLRIENFLPEGKTIEDIKLPYTYLGIKLETDKEKPSGATAEETTSPIILDLNGNGIETTIIDSSQAYFDFAGDHLAERTGWVGANDGLLVYDRNHDGKILDGSELFGNNTLLSNGQKAKNGFEALAELDSNQDGKIDSQDAAYNLLKVWQDSNSDGITDDGELKTLVEAGIVSISTKYKESNYIDQQGNEHR